MATNGWSTDVAGEDLVVSGGKRGLGQGISETSAHAGASVIATRYGPRYSSQNETYLADVAISKKMQKIQKFRATINQEDIYSTEHQEKVFIVPAREPSLSNGLRNPYRGFVLNDFYEDWGEHFRRCGARVVYSWAHTTFKDITEEVKANGGKLPPIYADTVAVDPQFLFDATSPPKKHYVPGVQEASQLPQLSCGPYTLGLSTPSRTKGQKVPSVQKTESLGVFVTSYPLQEILDQGTYGIFEVERRPIGAIDQEFKRVGFMQPNSTVDSGRDASSAGSINSDDFWAKYTGRDWKGRLEMAKYHILDIPASDRHLYIYRVRHHILNENLKPIASSAFSPLWTYSPPKRSRSPSSNSPPSKTLRLSPEATSSAFPKSPSPEESSSPKKDTDWADTVAFYADMESPPDHALLQASSAGSVDHVQMALNHGANVNVQDRSGHTPLALATKNRHCAVMNILLDNKADPDLPNKLGVNPLIWSTFHDETELVQLLVDRGANINFQYDKNTPLHFATINACLNGKSGNRDSSTVQLLKEKGAHLFVKDGEGRTALHIAQYFADDDLMGVLNPLAEVSIPPDLVDPLPPWSGVTEMERAEVSIAEWLVDPLEVLGYTPSIQRLPSIVEVVEFYYNKLRSYLRRWL